MSGLKKLGVAGLLGKEDEMLTLIFSIVCYIIRLAFIAGFFFTGGALITILYSNGRQ